MKHLLVNPAFPDLVGKWAPNRISDKARVWIITRGADGKLEEKIDPAFLARVEDAESIDIVIDALIEAAAEQDIAETRSW
ncbi:MAG TPA: hypothetical protein VID20_01795 [Sphingomicrobium sp.]